MAYLYASDVETALASVRTSLRRLIAHHGLKGYHETITRFWLLLIDGRLDRRACLADAVARIREELGDKHLIYHYYSREVLAPESAKESGSSLT